MESSIKNSKVGFSINELFKMRVFNAYELYKNNYGLNTVESVLQVNNNALRELSKICTIKGIVTTYSTDDWRGAYHGFSKEVKSLEDLKHYIDSSFTISGVIYQCLLNSRHNVKDLIPEEYLTNSQLYTQSIVNTAIQVETVFDEFGGMLYIYSTEQLRNLLTSEKTMRDALDTIILTSTCSKYDGCYRIGVKGDYNYFTSTGYSKGRVLSNYIGSLVGYFNHYDNMKKLMAVQGATNTRQSDEPMFKLYNGVGHREGLGLVKLIDNPYVRMFGIGVVKEAFEKAFMELFHHQKTFEVKPLKIVGKMVSEVLYCYRGYEVKFNDGRTFVVTYEEFIGDLKDYLANNIPLVCTDVLNTDRILELNDNVVSSNTGSIFKFKIVELMGSSERILTDILVDSECEKMVVPIPNGLTAKVDSDATPRATVRRSEVMWYIDYLEKVFEYLSVDTPSKENYESIKYDFLNCYSTNVTKNPIEVWFEEDLY